MKRNIFTMLLGLATVTAGAQNVFSVTDGGKHYNVPIGAQIHVDEKNGFVLNHDNKDYQFSLASKITPAEGQVKLPMAIKNNRWRAGLSSITSASTGIFSDSYDKFTWADDSVAFTDYELSGTVVDTVHNVPMVDALTKYYGDTVDIVFLKVSSGETGYHSLPSDTLCAWKETTHIGKIAALILSFGKDATTGEQLTTAVGVAKWASYLSTYTGVSGKEYTATGNVEYFDDLETAKDIVLNMENFSRSGSSYGLTAPTWNYLSAGKKLVQHNTASSDLLKPYKISVRKNISPAKPTKSNIESNFACRFDSPDPESAIIDYYYTATDSTAKFQYPELKSAANETPNMYYLKETNTWMGATCLYLVPSDGTTFSKYRKFKGYVHVKMLDGAEYKKYLSIDKKGVITVDDEWIQTEERTRNVMTSVKNEDNDTLQYFNLKFMAFHLGSGNGLEKNVLSYDEAHAIETDLNNAATTNFVPRVWAYIPYSLVNIKPSQIMHHCNFSFMCKNADYMSEELQENGVALKLSDDVAGTMYEDNYRYWIFTDADGHLVAYTLNNSGLISALEWFE